MSVGNETANPSLPVGEVSDRADGTSKVHQTLLEVNTRSRIEISDITPMIARAVEESRVAQGIVVVGTLHTTAAIRINENEPLFIEDASALLDRLAPAGAHYRHDDLGLRSGPLPPDERVNGDAHLRALLLGATETLSVAGGVLLLGRWQSILLVELDGPRLRTVIVTVIGAGGEGR